MTGSLLLQSPGCLGDTCDSRSRVFRGGVGMVGEEGCQCCSLDRPGAPQPSPRPTVDSTWLGEWPSQPPWLLWPPRPPCFQHPSSVTSPRFPSEKDARISQPITGACSWKFPCVQGPDPPGCGIPAPGQVSVPQFLLSQIRPTLTLRDLQKLLT